jgi:hypothetical protein
MITELKKVPVTTDSYPFITAEFHCRLSEKGYVEDEYFMSGTANVYEEDGAGLKVLFPDAPYTTRLLVRRPLDVSHFSGNVVIEVLNASAMFDIDRMWINSWPFFMRNGDIFIGISSKGHVVQAMKSFDAKRYDPINWADPMPERPAPNAVGPFRFLSGYESGLFWDMQVDLAKLLRTGSPLNPIAAYGKNWLYLTGWSQSGSYLVRIAKSFASLPENDKDFPLFDGYLGAGCGNEMAPINSRVASFVREPGVPKGSMMGMPVPYININTESENRMCNWVGDFDEKNYKFRTYQIAGSSHDSKYNLLDYYEGQAAADLVKAGIKNAYWGLDGEPLDIPYEYAFNAIWRNLYAWTRQKVPAPHAPKIETEITGPGEADAFGAYVRNVTDAFGNARGGIRLPAVEAPVGQYINWSSDGKRTNPMFGKVLPFSPEKLKAIYGSIGEYKVLVEKIADRCVAQGFLLTEERDDCVSKTVAMAEQRGLH